MISWPWLIYVPLVCSLECVFMGFLCCLGHLLTPEIPHTTGRGEGSVCFPKYQGEALARQAFGSSRPNVFDIISEIDHSLCHLVLFSDRYVERGIGKRAPDRGGAEAAGGVYSWGEELYLPCYGRGKLWGPVLAPERDCSPDRRSRLGSSFQACPLRLSAAGTQGINHLIPKPEAFGFVTPYDFIKSTPRLW